MKSATILIIDGQPICREPLAVLLQSKGFLCMTAASVRDALRIAGEANVDLVLLDIQLEGMSGIDLIGSLRKHSRMANKPILILTDAKEKGHVMRAASLGIHGYMLKEQFSTERLLTRIQELVGHEEPAPASVQHPKIPMVSKMPGITVNAQAAGTVNPRRKAAVTPAAKKPSNSGDGPKLLSRDETLERLDKVAGGKTMAGVVAQVIALANSPDADLQDLVKVLESDPVMASRVMQLAASASVGGRGRIRSVEDAVRNVGVKEIRNMALSIGILGSFPPNEVDGFNTMRCWQHSFAVAEIMGLICKAHSAQDACVNHLVGLCHDLGEILLRQHFPTEFQAILEHAIRHRLPVHEVESSALGVRHPELVSRLLSRIGLPQPVVYAIREYYERQVRGQSAGMSAATRALCLANHLAHGMLLAASTQAVVAPVTRMEWRNIENEKPPPILNPEATRNHILATTNSLARLSERDERQLLEPLISKRKVRVWYVRPETYAALDPLGIFLSLVTDVTVSCSMPEVGDWEAIDGLVVVNVRSDLPAVNAEELDNQRRSARRDDLPILTLVGQEVERMDDNGITTAQYPVTLDELNQWLAALSNQAAIAT